MFVDVCTVIPNLLAIIQIPYSVGRHLGFEIEHHVPLTSQMVRRSRENFVSIGWLVFKRLAILSSFMRENAYFISRPYWGGLFGRLTP